jgi:hypothetical protein
MLLNASYLPYLIEEAFPAKPPYPKRFAKYENPQAWLDQDFFLEEIKMSDFLAKQLAGRVRNLYQTDPHLKDTFLIPIANGEYLTAKKRFKIVVDIESKKIGHGAIKQDVNFSQIWKVISQTMRRYDFKDYNTVELFNIADAKKEIMTRADLIDKFWPKWLLRR